MSGKIERASRVTDSYVITNDPATSPRMPYGATGGGVLIVDAVVDATKIDWYICFDSTDDPVPIYDAGAALSTDISVDCGYAVPDAAFASQFIVGVTDAGTATIRLSVKG